MHYEKHQLKNKANIIFVPLKDTASITVLVIYPVGSRYESEKMLGVSHFVEHMFFAGTKKYPTHRELAYATEQFGGWHTAFTWIDYQKHEVCLPVEKFEQGIEVVLETLFFSLAKKEEIEKEKGRISEEILRNKADPEKAIWDYGWLPLFFQGTSIDRPCLGTINDINHITRADILSFLKTYFYPQNIVFLAAGDVTASKIKKVFVEALEDFSYPTLLKKTSFDSGNTFS